jgi:hypothetical protein
LVGSPLALLAGFKNISPRARRCEVLRPARLRLWPA